MMITPPPGRQPLAKWVQEFSASQSKCHCCNRRLERAHLLRSDIPMGKMLVRRMVRELDEAEWDAERQKWRVVCRFCANLHSYRQQGPFDVMGFYTALMSGRRVKGGTCREYAVRLRRLNGLIATAGISPMEVLTGDIDSFIKELLPAEKKNYLIAARKYIDVMKIN